MGIESYNLEEGRLSICRIIHLIVSVGIKW